MRNNLTAIGLSALLGALVSLPSFADEVVASAAGGWFAVDGREVKDTTWEGGEIVGGATNVLLQSSPNAWSEAGGGGSATITWESTSGGSGTVAAETTAESVRWTPEEQSGTNTLTYTSGSVVKTAQFVVVYVQPDGGPYTEVVDGIEWTFMVANGEASVGGGDWDSPAVPRSTKGVVTIPSTLGECPVTSIGNYAFYECNLSGIELNEGLVSIGSCAFWDNYNLRLVVIPSTVKSVEDHVFSSCSKLSSVFFKGNAPEYVDSYFYGGTPYDLVTFVRSGSTGWRSAESAELPDTWPTSGSYQRKIRTWSTYPDLCWLVTFDLGEDAVRIGGGELEQYVREGDSAVAPEVKANEGFAFCGWDGSLDSIDCHRTINAVCVEIGAPILEGVSTSVEPSWSGVLSVEYVSTADEDVTNLLLWVYRYVDGEWQRIPDSLITGDTSMSAGRHEFAIDYRELQTDADDLILKLSVKERADAELVFDNYDEWTNEDGVWRSRKIFDNEETSLMATFEGVGALTFNWKSSSEGGCDRLSCFVDGDSIGRISGISDWREMSMELTDGGAHTIEWVYSKDGSVSSGQDCGWIQDVEIIECVAQAPVVVSIPTPTLELEAEYLADGKVKLSASDPSARIYYTVDGTVPTAASVVYEQPVEWAEFKQIRAVALTDDGDWSDMLVGSEIVRITLDPAYGIQVSGERQVVLKRRGDTYGELPEAYREGVEFGGWTHSYWSVDGGCIDPDEAVQQEDHTLYASWLLDYEDVLDPDRTLDYVDIESNWSLRRDSSYYLDEETGEGSLTSRVWKEFLQIDSYAEPNCTNEVANIGFSGVGVLTWSRLSGYNAQFILDGERVYPKDGRLNVLTGGEHCLTIQFENTSDEWDEWGYIYVGGLRWANVCEPVEVSFDAMGGTASADVRQYQPGDTYGELPTASHTGGYDFLGWYTAAVGGERISATDYVDFEINKLYARWQADLGAALDNSQLSFVSSGASGWAGLSGEAHCGDLAATSVGLAPGETNVLSTTVSGAGVLSFWWKMSDKTYQGFLDRVLTLEVDGKAFALNRYASKTAANGGWSHFTLSLTNDCLHSVRWLCSFANDLTASLMMSFETADVSGVWIDEVEWTRNAMQDDVVGWGYSSIQVARNLPGTSVPMLQAYSSRIASNPLDYDARIRRAIVRAKELSENMAFRTLLSRYGFALADDWSSIFGAFDADTAPETNDAVDELASEIMPKLDEALADLDVIPTSWAGAVALSAQDYPVDEDVYVDAVDVVMMRAMLHGAKAALDLAQGYDLTTDTDKIAEEIGLSSSGEEHCPELTCESIIKAHPLFASRVRDAALLQASREELRVGLGLIHDLDSLIRNRPQGPLHFFEYDESYDRYLDVISAYVLKAIAALDEVVTVDGSDFVGFGRFRRTNETVRVTFAPIFEGKVLRSLLPPFEGDLPVLSSIPDITFAGVFPDWTMQNMQPWLSQINGIWYECVCYAVHFNANGGAGEMADQVFTNGIAQALATNEFVREGCRFVGWSDVQGEGALHTWSDGEVVSNLTDVAGGVVDMWAVWEEVKPVPPSEWVPVTQEDTMLVYAVVSNKQAKVCVDAEGSILAAFAANGECRGKTVVMNGPQGKLYSLSVGVKSATEKGFTFKVWDAATGEIAEIKQSLDCNSGKKHGALKAPIVFAIGFDECELSLKEGWNWIATPINPEDDSVGAVLSGFTFADDDVIKSSGAMATYCEGEWYPSDFKVEPGKAYMVYKSVGGAESATIEGESVSETIAVKAGWNWIGSMCGESLTIAEVSHSGGFADDDVFKGSGEFTTYCEGYWYPDDFVLVPGVGYKACLANAGTLSFGGTKGAKLLGMATDGDVRCPSAVLLGASVGVGCPSWEPVTQEDTLMVYLQVSNGVDKALIETANSTVAAFAADGECRGVAKVMTGPTCKLFQLSVGIKSKLESDFTLKVWNSATSNVYDLVGTIAGNEEGKIGALKTPYVMVADVPVPDPLPELVEPTEKQVKEVMEQAKDKKLAVEITNGTEYVTFRDWAGKVKDGDGEMAGSAAVMASDHAWLSFALAMETLLQAAIADKDLKVEEFKPTAEAGKFDFTVSVEGVEVGSEASKENLKKVFGLEGATSLGVAQGEGALPTTTIGSGFSADNVDISFGKPVDGKVKLTAGPKDATQKSFFMKMKVK